MLGRVRDALLGKTPERRLLTKIDAFMLSFLCLMYWSNYLNRSNLSYAYVTGMEEEIGFHGNDFTTATTVFTVGYTVGMIPQALAIYYIPARIWLPVMTILWGILSCCLSATHSVSQVYTVRFLQALAESSTFSGAHYLLGSWYLDDELGKRSALFASCAQIGSLFSGFLQGAIYDSLNGVHGRSGWRWTFIIDGILAIVIALWGLAVFPNTPRTTKAFYLNKSERTLAVSRIPQRPHDPLTWSGTWEVLKGWRYWGFSLLFTVSSQLEAYGTNGIVAIWLRSTGLYSTAKNNYYALGLTSVAIATTLLAGLYTDIWGKRWSVNIFMTIAMVVSATMLLVWDISLGAKYFAFYLGGCGYAGQGSNFAWANEVSRSDLERTFILYSMNLWSNAFTAWWIILIWPVTSAPKYSRGMISTIPLAILTLLIAVVIQILWRRATRQGARDGLTASTGGEASRCERAGAERGSGDDVALQGKGADHVKVLDAPGSGEE